MRKDYKTVFNGYKNTDFTVHSNFQRCKKTLYYNIRGIYHNMIVKQNRSYDEWSRDINALSKYEGLVNSLKLDEYRQMLQ
jgi:hypothetical protein